jgi:tRNA A-37 threonylcarbamoyl transferase component Bud32/mono/diheme cytochrome c family protein
MPTLLTCPQGHQWEIEVDGPLPGTSGQAICPVCSTAIDLPASDSTRWVVTTTGTVMLLPEEVDAAAVANPPTPPPSEPETIEVQPRPTDADPDATQPPPERAAVRTPLDQVTVPGYEILAELGRGGMGVVYKARQTKLKRLVALKMILAGAHASTKELARFNAEAEAVARLHHPNIVQIYEVGEHQEKPFFSLEFIEGGNLAQRYRGQVMPPPQAAELLQTLARAIHHAHLHGIIHRDLKPANILLTADGIPKITDFGLAKQVDREISATQSGAVMGTANYMAPEQAWGKAKGVGPSADVWSLGALLYELLTGRPPFIGETPMDTILRVMSEEPMAPSRLRPGVPRDLETICLKCLNKSPAQRYPTALALAEDLQRFQEGRPILARPIGPLGRFIKWAKRHPAISTLAAVLMVIAGLMVLGSATARQRREEAQRRQADRLAPRAQEILHRYCWECHGKDPDNIEKFDVFDFQALLDAKRKMVVPGLPDDSRLIKRIVDESMPPQEYEELPRMSGVELNVLRDWIAGGAPPFPHRELASPAPPSPEEAAAAAAVKDIFRDYCYSCHRFGRAEGGIKILNHDLLVNKRKVVVPGNPETSELYELVVTKDQHRMMPPVKMTQRPSSEEIDAIRRWIVLGAPEFPR